MRPHLETDHTATTTICTKHQDHPDLQELQERCLQELIDNRVYAFLQYRLSTLQRLYRHYADTVILHPCTTFVYDSLKKDLTLKTYPLVLVICLVLCQSHSYINICRIDAFIDPATYNRTPVYIFLSIFMDGLGCRLQQRKTKRELNFSG